VVVNKGSGKKMCGIVEKIKLFCFCADVEHGCEQTRQKEQTKVGKRDKNEYIRISIAK
jgi:hypothetical protein